MAPKFIFCPNCSHALERNSSGYLACPECNFVHWNNPVPVVATVVPMIHKWLDAAGIPKLDVPDGGIVLVQRDIGEFAGDWCLPCGHIEQHGHPKAEAVRETEEESGLLVRIEKLLCACNPMPGEVNQMVLSYLARPVGGTLRFGSDARGVGVFTPATMPKICFRSHQMLFDQWFAGNLGTLTGEDLRI